MVLVVLAHEPSSKDPKTCKRAKHTERHAARVETGGINGHLNNKVEQEGLGIILAARGLRRDGLTKNSRAFESDIRTLLQGFYSLPMREYLTEPTIRNVARRKKYQSATNGMEPNETRGNTPLRSILGQNDLEQW